MDKSRRPDNSKIGMSEQNESEAPLQNAATGSSATEERGNTTTADPGDDATTSHGISIASMLTDEGLCDNSVAEEGQDEGSSATAASGSEQDSKNSAFEDYQTKIKNGSYISIAHKRKEDGREYNIGNWSPEELKALHDAINVYGASENAIYALACKSGRSQQDVKEKLAEIRDMIRERNDLKTQRKRETWLKQETGKVSGKLKIQKWSDAIRKIQSEKRQISDYSREALVSYLWEEFGHSGTSQDSRVVYPATDSAIPPCKEFKDTINFARLFRFLHSCANGAPPKQLRLLEAATLLNILEELQAEVDAPELEDKRRIFHGMFTDIVNGDFSDFDFRFCKNDTDGVKVQLNPLNLSKNTFGVGDEIHIGFEGHSALIGGHSAVLNQKEIKTENRSSNQPAVPNNADRVQNESSPPED